MASAERKALERNGAPAPYVLGEGFVDSRLPISRTFKPWVRISQTQDGGVFVALDGDDDGDADLIFGGAIRAATGNRRSWIAATPFGQHIWGCLTDTTAAESEACSMETLEKVRDRARDAQSVEPIGVPDAPEFGLDDGPLGAPQCEVQDDFGDNIVGDEPPDTPDDLEEPFTQEEAEEFDELINELVDQGGSPPPPPPPPPPITPPPGEPIGPPIEPPETTDPQRSEGIDFDSLAPPVRVIIEIFRTVRPSLTGVEIKRSWRFWGIGGSGSSDNNRNGGDTDSLAPDDEGSFEDPRCRQSVNNPIHNCGGSDILTCMVQNNDPVYARTGGFCRETVGPDDRPTVTCGNVLEEIAPEQECSLNPVESGSPNEINQCPVERRRVIPGDLAATLLGGVIGGICKADCPGEPQY